MWLKRIWGKQQNPDSSWGEAYAHGAKNFDDNKEEITELNKKIYSKTEKEIDALYDEGRTESLEYFEEMYKALGTKFDEYFFESETGKLGLDVVNSNKEIFKDSEGAVVFPGEDYGLHTRVFINSEGLPTYEAKEIGLNKAKFDQFKPDLSIIETGNEINNYFKVLLKVMELIMPEVAEVTKHVGHGMLRLPEGKMSSRTGDVITARSMINDVKDRVSEKMEEKNEEIAGQIAVGAIKYSILKQAPGKDVIFDFEKSLSFEGSSGPYLQYTRARSLSLLEKGKDAGFSPNLMSDAEAGETEKLLQRFPEVVESAMAEHAPQHVVTYLTELAASFNTFYGQNKIIDTENKEVSEYRLAITKAVAQTLENGLWVLGIEAPDRM